jgi:hypothetical protein
LSVRVECYSGYTYAQEPRALDWQGQHYVVRRIVRRWRAPEGPGFRVEVTELDTPAQLESASPAADRWEQPRDKFEGKQHAPMGTRLFDLRYIEAEDRWTLDICNSIQEDQR